MKYLKLCEIYKKISETTKRLEKIEILISFFSELRKEKNLEILYLLNGKINPDYDQRELGISEQILIKALSKSFVIPSEKIIKEFKKLGDLGDVAESLSLQKKQNFLFSSDLTCEKVIETLRKVQLMEGKKAIEKKISFISELFSLAKKDEIKFLTRTILGNLRIGISVPTILEAISKYFFNGENKELIEDKYNLSNDLVEIFLACSKGIEELKKIDIKPGIPLNVMLAIKVQTIEEGLDFCGKPAAIEQKYDGFRALLNKTEKGDFFIFTRKLENVTKQFPDVVKILNENIKAKSFILDSEIVGYNEKEKKYLPFEAISQRIKRKYDIEKISKEIPVEINVFDCLYLDGESKIKLPFIERRRLLDKIIKEENLKIRKAVQIKSSDVKEIKNFLDDAIKKGNEGIMIKNLNAEYKQGRRVGYMCKLKPELNEIDLVIVGAEYGTGKRSGSLTSFILACRDEDELLEVGKVSSGLKEKEEEGLTYEELTKILKPLIVKENGREVVVKPEVVVSVSYQNIQESPSYKSGYALRFPKILRYRPDRSWRDIATLEEIKKEGKQNFKKEKRVLKI